MVYLWRAVDAEDEVLDVLVQPEPNDHVALKLVGKLTRRSMSWRVGFVYSAGWGGGEAAIIGMLNGRDICIVFTTLRETKDGNGGPLAR